ncbi:MAG: ATPase [Betaproteobacteria bacterium RIFCSPLOWO2_12_FULL_65_14]|nr:MAG: ATPase [Betaproteobacteria bacterium RIFCSPLOWO2_12_FULL_65_14]
MLWHSSDVAAVLGELRTDPSRGLAAAEAAQRLASQGANELAQKGRTSPLRLFLSQFRNTLVVILIVATVLSALLGELADAAIIAAIVLFCAALGFIQEYRAERALDALKRMLAPTVRVLRDGNEVRIPSRDLVPGDVMLLEAGDRVAGDARVVDAHSLKCDEAPLTGESFPVEKSAATLPDETPAGDRRNMIFAGTTVSYGRGKAVVTGTGGATEFGKIAEQVSSVKAESTPLEKRTAEIGRWLGIIAVAVCGIAITVSIARAWTGGELDLQLVLTMTMFAIALAVAAVPEALAAIVTGALAIGMHEMAKRNALVRRMPAVETLGCTTVVCADKTGTLTKGEMTVRRIFVGGQAHEVSGAGYEPDGKFAPALSPDDEAARLFLTGALLCNDAVLANEAGRWSVKGDPTEGALVVLSAKAGIGQERMREKAPRIGEIPFSSERKRMTTVHRMAGGRDLAFVKGAPEALLDRCASMQEGGARQPLSDAMRASILAANEQMADDALRVLAIAYRELEPGTAHAEDAVERELVFLGLIGMMDPPREEARQAVEVCRQVHIRPVMITGDHKLTAVAVARELGIYREGDLVLTGEELGRLGDEEFARMVERVSVYARVSPMDKLKIVRAWKSRGEVVAMTGDGVNDAPALKHADIGIAMGITGTDVAKEAADMVLGDDNFATIVRAIERGRWIYDNIRKYLTYLLRANITEVVVLGGVVIVAGPELLPLLPAAILYINLATDGLPALALGLSPADRDIMQRPPRDPKESVFSRDVRVLVLLGVLIECPIFLWIYFDNFGDIEAARTKIFMMFVFVELIIVMSFRSLRYSLFEAPPHKWLLIAIGWELGLLGVLLQFASVREAFGIAMPSWSDLGIALATSVFVLAAIEAAKAYLRATAKDAVRAGPKAISPAPTASLGRAHLRASTKGATSMRRILIPVDGSGNATAAVQHAINQFVGNSAVEIHLLNVQRPLSSYVSRFVSRRSIQGYHRDESEKALAPIRRMLASAGIPYAAHQAVGDHAAEIARAARRLRCDLILIGTARKNSLTRLVENSVTNKVVELSSVPVEVVPGEGMSKWERYGIPAGIGAALTLALAAMD